MYKLNLFFIVFFLTQNIYSQVHINYEKQLTGSMHLSDVWAINVSNFVGVDIDYIYKGWAIDSTGNKVIDVQSNVLTQSKGPTNYNKNDKFDSWKKGELSFKSYKYTIDTASYSGKLTYFSELLHPIDNTSIIARKQKEVYLKNGLYVSESGVPLTDPRLMSLNIDYTSNEKFELDYLFKKMKFDNKNESEYCQTLSFEIMQNGTKIYASSLENFCVSTGVSYMSANQIKALDVTVNTYADRSKTAPINISYRLGESNGSRNISNISHSDFDFSPIQYTHYASGLSFDFINSADIISNYSASSFVVEINQDNSVEKLEMLGDRGSPVVEGMKMYHPFSTKLYREDFNGSIVVTMLQKENFTASQWKAFLSFVNNFDQSELTEIIYKDVTILAPKVLANQRKSYGGNRVRMGYAFIIIDHNTVTLYDASYYKLLVEDPKSPKREKLDLNEALKSIQYNGIHLGFTFENEILKEIKFEEGEVVSQENRKELRDKMCRYHHHFSSVNGSRRQQYMKNGRLDLDKLDQKIAKDNSTAMSDIPQYIVSTPTEIKNLKTKSSSSDSMDIQVTYRATEKVRKQQSNRVEEYDYEEEYNITSSAYMMQGVSFSRNSSNVENNKKILKIASIVLDLNPPGQRIEISKLKGVSKDPKWIEELVRYQNLESKNDPLKSKKIQVDELTFYVPVKTLEKRQWSKEKLCIYIEIGKNMYRLDLLVPSTFDRNYILNNMIIEGKQFTFDFEGRNIVNIYKN